MKTITALIHTKNSAASLERCLRSLHWCDEIHVIDMQSTDDTLKIAKKYATHVKKIPASVPFADPVRQQFMDEVTTDWTFLIDHDEEVPPGLAKKIRSAIERDDVQGFQLPRKNMIFGRWIEHTGFWPDYITRVFQTGKGTYPPYVHAQPVIDGKTEQFPATEEYAYIHHHYQTIEQFILRMNVYTTLEAQKAKEQGNVPTRFTPIQAFFGQFFTRYFHQQGYKDGSHGLVLSLLMGVYSMVVMCKLWEQTPALQQDVAMTEVEYAVNDACRQTMYWTANEQLAKEQRGIRKLALQIRRKFNS